MCVGIALSQEVKKLLLSFYLLYIYIHIYTVLKIIHTLSVFIVFMSFHGFLSTNIKKLPCSELFTPCSHHVSIINRKAFVPNDGLQMLLVGHHRISAGLLRIVSPLFPIVGDWKAF